MSYRTMGLHEKLEEGMCRMGYAAPLPVQELVYEKIRSGGDFMIRSETGSGKTLAYLLPLFSILSGQEELSAGRKAVVLVPTHELAVQVNREAERLADASGIPLKSIVIVGNVNITRQIDKLKEKPQLIIGTPGRIAELMNKRKIGAHLVKTIVLDEGDKLLDENNLIATKEVIKCTQKDRQLLLFSASVAKDAQTAAKTLMKEPELLAVKKQEEIPASIEHSYFVAERRYKLDTLRGILTALQPEKAMIFINRKNEIEEAEAKLKYHHYPVACIHGNGMKKEDRKQALDGFRSGKVKYLIATDLAARGLHFEGIDMVCHVSIPENPLDYLHRAGRTGRNGTAGSSILLVTAEEEQLVRKYCSQFDIQINKKQYYCGKIS